MCGIAGFIDYRKRSTEQILIKCTDSLIHRGPDGSGYDFTETDFCQVGLGHRRLSIIDLSNAGAQPMHYRHLSIVFNGEIYNYEEIKKELLALGHNFTSHSDTEVILHAFDEWGKEMMPRFIGMFAFAIYDRQNQEVWCFRDRPGSKPLYFYWHDGLFLFGSELKCFHPHPGFKKEINTQALLQFFQYGYILAPLSIFKHARKLGPGHYLHINLKTQEVQEKKYWNVFDYYNKPKLNISYQEALTETEKLLVSACQYRMVADVPVGVFLSGGYDSTAVTAILQANRTEKLKTYTIGFFEEDHNEAVYAKKVANYLGTSHTEHYCTTREAQDILPDIPFFCDEPFGDSSIIPTILVSKLARKEVTVALSADAGDETYAGYNKYPLALSFQNKLNLVPDFLKPTAGRFLKYFPSSILKAIVRNPAVDLKKQRLSNLFHEKSVSAVRLMDIFLSQAYSTEQLEALLTSMPQKPHSNFNSRDLLRPDLGEIDSMLAIDYITYLPDDILAKVDRAGMSVSLEGREPLLDHRLIQYAAQLPESFKMTSKNKKIILKDIVHKYVPKEMMERPKMGFGIPVFSWLRSDLKYYADEYLDKDSFAHGLFKQEEVDKIISRFYNGDKNFNNPFWYLLMFQMWYKKWMN